MRNHTILLVEDESGIRELIRLYLERDGFRVVAASNGEQALTRMEEEAPQLALLDIEMPGLDGFELCTRIRRRQAIPILFLSCRRDTADKLKSFELGGDDYITKPFDFAELSARVRVHLRRYQQSGQPLKSTILTFRDLEIDLDQCRFYLDGEPLDLSVKEARLLLLLAQHPNQVWSAEQLYDHIWGIDSFGDIQTVKVHISKLRSKIEKDAANPQYIRTVRGFGYVFQG